MRLIYNLYHLFYVCIRLFSAMMQCCMAINEVHFLHFIPYRSQNSLKRSKFAEGMTILTLQHLFHFELSLKGSFICRSGHSFITVLKLYCKPVFSITTANCKKKTAFTILFRKDWNEI